MAHKDGIIVLGPPRSGTTLLRRLLDGHPEIDCPGETYVLGAAARFLRVETTAQGVQMGVEPGLKVLGVQGPAILDRVRELAFGWHREHAEAQGKARWAIKTAVDAFYVPAIERLCRGHAQFICIVRNGLDVVASMEEMTQKTGIVLQELHPYVQRFPHLLEAFAHAWVDSSSAVADLVDRAPDDALLLRYEDLVAEPDGVLAGVARHLGVSAYEGWASRALGVPSSAGIGDWKAQKTSAVGTGSVGRHQALPRPALASLVPIVAATMARLGYAVPKVDEASTAQLDRRTQLAMLLNQQRDDASEG